MSDTENKNQEKTSTDEFMQRALAYPSLKASHKDLMDTLEFLLTDIEWQPNSPSLKLVKRMIKKAKSL